MAYRLYSHSVKKVPLQLAALLLICLCHVSVKKTDAKLQNTKILYSGICTLLHVVIKHYTHQTYSKSDHHISMGIAKMIFYKKVFKFDS